MKPTSDRHGLPREGGQNPVGGRGLTLVEVLIGITIMAVGVLGTLGMFHAGFNTVGEGGRTTMALTAARQLLEDVRLVPFNNLANLNNFDTNNAGTLPGGGVELAIARKWRYALAGAGTGWTFTPTETQQWNRLLSGVGGGSSVAGQGVITVINRSPVIPGPLTLQEVTVTVRVPAGGRAVTLSTYISRP
jgi:prepilin-type N-terminal cleavage/methylation domain-containing protein